MAQEEETMVGHNSKGIFESETRRALFFTHLNPLWKLEQKRQEIVAEMTKLKRQAKADGFEAYEVNHGLAIRKTEKPETVDNQMLRLMAITRYMSQPIGYQFSLIDAASAGSSRDIDRAYEAGEMQALQGESLRNPHDQSAPQWKAFNDGWDGGQEQMRAALQERMEADKARKASATKAVKSKSGNGDGAATVRRRGRPPGSKNKPKDSQTFSAAMAAKNAEVDEGPQA